MLCAIASVNSAQQFKFSSRGHMIGLKNGWHLGQKRTYLSQISVNYEHRGRFNNRKQKAMVVRDT
eukprot:4066588-Amphidinium_carterae.1